MSVKLLSNQKLVYFPTSPK